MCESLTFFSQITFCSVRLYRIYTEFFPCPVFINIVKHLFLRNYSKAVKTLTLSFVNKDKPGIIKFCYMDIDKPFSIERSGL